jgi:hypothetical protein
MGPLSRFEKIEAERPPKDPEGPAEPARFLATETPGPAAPPAPDEVHPAEGALDRLPTLACAVCGEESSKFAGQCRACGSGLDTPEARALNLERLARFDAEAEVDRRARAAQLVAPPPEALAPEPEPLLGPHGPGTWPRWAQGLAVLGVLALFVPRLLLLAAPAVALWLLWRRFLR